MAITPFSGLTPSRSDRTTFSDRVDAFVTWLINAISEFNSTAAAMNLNSTNSTSTTTLSIAVGSQSLTVQTSKSYQPGMTVKIASTASPANWMAGDVTSYNSGTGALVVDVYYVRGSASGVSSWTITQGAAPIATETPGLDAVDIALHGHLGGAAYETVETLGRYIQAGGAGVKIVTVTADYTVLPDDTHVLNNKPSTGMTVTLPSASLFPGRSIYFRSIQSYGVTSSSANVVPLAGGSPAAAMLPGPSAAGMYCVITSDGTNWLRMI